MQENTEYKVTIEETISETFKVVAENADEAYKIAIEKYKNGEFVLSDANMIFKQIQVSDNNQNYIDWEEF